MPAALPVAVPTRPRLCGLPLALSETLSEAARGPMTLGVKVTLIAQLAPTARLVPQVFVSAKSPLFVPTTAIEVMLTVTVPVFVHVADCGGLDVPIA